jgi:hypothetical protein
LCRALEDAGGRSIGAKKRLRLGCNRTIFFWSLTLQGVRKNSVKMLRSFAKAGNVFLNTGWIREQSYGRRSMHKSKTKH